ncbi:MAG: hypothetical protein H0V93_03465 [Euzebyales bacterium]|nr:hypothetical protein [Euzebyales bacterium]
MTGDRVRRAVLALAALGLVAGLSGLGAALLEGQSLLESPGARVGAFHHLNPLGGIVTTVLAALALVAGLTRSGMLALVSAAGFAAAAAVTVLGSALGASSLGGTAATVAVFLGLGGGLAACALTPERAARSDRS